MVSGCVLKKKPCKATPLSMPGAEFSSKVMIGVDCIGFGDTRFF